MLREKCGTKQDLQLPCCGMRFGISKVSDQKLREKYFNDRPDELLVFFTESCMYKVDCFQENSKSVLGANWTSDKNKNARKEVQIQIVSARQHEWRNTQVVQTV